MYRIISSNGSKINPILKNARYFIIYRAKKMIQRWQMDWENNRKKCSKNSNPSRPYGQNSLQEHLVWDECRVVDQEQRVLDALDDTLNGCPLNHLQRRCYGHHSWYPSYHQSNDSSLSDGLFSRSGCTMRYRS